MADYLPKFTGPFTITAAGALIGGRLVASTNAHATDAAVDVIGVAAHDTPIGRPCTIYPIEGYVHRLTASGAIAKGAQIVAAANGKIRALAAVTTPTPADVTGTRAVLGTALAAATTDGDVIATKR